MEDKNWFIWSIEHNAWWGENHRGYVEDIRFAGRYSYEEAMQIVYGANINMRQDFNAKPYEAMVHVDVLK